MTIEEPEVEVVDTMDNEVEAELDAVVNVRKLTRGDRVKLTLLIQKFVDISGTDSLVKMAPPSISAEGDEAEQTEEDKGSSTAQLLESAYELIEQMLTVIESDMADWFCELINETRSTYDEMDFDIEVQVIEGIITQKGFGNFFTRGSRVVSKIKQLVSPFKR